MKVNLEITKEIMDEGKIKLIHYELTLIPENEQDNQKFKELEEDFYFEKFFAKDNIINKKCLKILF